ncbi:MAG: hypothetical protein GF331_13505 [Chitinivibrionales bacterium]|nr:hypothetical protein [Chitinivibrionales bacterium]
MTPDVQYNDLTREQRRLLDLMSNIGFGRIEDLLVQHGQPVFNPAPRVYCEIKLEHDGSDHPRSPRTNYLVKAPVRSLLQRLEAMGNGRIESIVVAHGLPLRMTLETAPGHTEPMLGSRESRPNARSRARRVASREG